MHRRVLVTGLMAALLPLAGAAQSSPDRSPARNTYLPVLGSAPETGLQFGATILRTFRRGPDATTRVSRYQVTAIATAQSQRKLSGTIDVWSSGNARRNRLSVEIMDFPLTVYAIGSESPQQSEGTYAAFGVDAQWLGQQRVAHGFYLGGVVRFDGVQALDPDFTDWDSTVARPPLRTQNQVKLQGMATVDTRDHQIAAQSGVLGQFTASTSSGAVDGTFHTSTKHGLDLRHYWGLPHGGVLAIQGTVEALASAGGPPDFLPALGADSLMRGYVRARFRDNAATATQLEVRSGFHRRLGVVAFASAGTLGRSLGDLGSHGLIAAFGGGLRYQLSAADRSRIRIDYARGQNGGALYIALGEAF